MILLLSRCGAVEKFCSHFIPGSNTESDVDIDNDDDNNSKQNLSNKDDDFLPIDKNAINKTDDNTSTSDEKNGNNYNKFIGYSSVIVNSSYPTLDLKNDTFNKSYAKYTIYNKGIKIYETDLIAPGKLVEWNIVKTLKEKGTYNLTQSCSFYDVTFDDNGNITSQVKNGTDVNNTSLEITIE